MDNTSLARADDLLTENGFDFAYFPPASGKTTSLVIYLHGIGDNAHNFARGAAAIQAALPGAAVIALQGPIEIHHPDLGDRHGYSWFPYGGARGPQVKTWISHIFNRLPIAGQVENFAHAQLQKLGLQEKDLGYIGNSMGAIVALQTAVTAKRPPAAVALRGGAVPPFTKVRQKSVDVFLQMGELDNVFNYDKEPPQTSLLKRAFGAVAEKFSLHHNRSIARLQKQGITPAAKIYEGQGHMLNGDAMKDSADFIAAALKKRQSPAI